MASVAAFAGSSLAAATTYAGRSLPRSAGLSGSACTPLSLRRSSNGKIVCLKERKPETPPARFQYPFQSRSVNTVTEERTVQDNSKQLDEFLDDLKAKWDGVENKSTVAIYAGGALTALWLSSTVVGAINTLPLVPKLLELVGLGYTGWFVYRYLLFKSSRKELVDDIEELKAKISGSIKETTGEDL